MIKVYKPGEKRKSLSECGCAAQCAEVTSCVRGTPVRVVVTHGLCEKSVGKSRKLVQRSSKLQGTQGTSRRAAPRVTRVEP